MNVYCTEQVALCMQVPLAPVYGGLWGYNAALGTQAVGGVFCHTHGAIATLNFTYKSLYRGFGMIRHVFPTGCEDDPAGAVVRCHLCVHGRSDERGIQTDRLANADASVSIDLLSLLLSLSLSVCLSLSLSL